jgi:hypothetical protein
MPVPSNRAGRLLLLRRFEVAILDAPTAGEIVSLLPTPE